MAFGVKLMALRDWCRGVILPVSELIDIIRTATEQNRTEQNILDFGAGTLFWTKKLTFLYPESTIYAVDTFYAENEAKLPKTPNVIYLADIAATLTETDFALAWCCDVLHHISAENERGILTQMAAKSETIIVKDIDCTHRFGNFMNRMHDRYINGERIRDIDPKRVAALLESVGFAVEYRYLPKIWYPHFVLIARRSK
ncbi:hypothetical protein FACS1894167_02500 [Synergistales bacterium]|nr:hypothetical protein FACS1894167_02500 [Synergistales bacterium]